MSQNNDFECCICLDSDKTLIMLKCHHLHIVCLKCYREIDKCPICRSLIERDQQLIDSCQIEIEDMKKLILIKTILNKKKLNDQINYIFNP